MTGGGNTGEAPTAPLIGIARHRLSTDGNGVTTLVAFHGCPLKCRYCLNNQCHDTMPWRVVTPQTLLDEVMTDNLYFLATGGGVTFGGGEPLLRSHFIKAFAAIMPPQWHVTLETSLAVARRHLEEVLPHVDEWIVDIKDTNPLIYKRYTGRAARRALDNLRWLLRHEGWSDKVVVRLPRIPGHNTQDDVQRSRATLQGWGVTRFDEFDYVVDK